MTDSKLKVNDKRMFTADGELREEFKHLEDAPPPDPAAAAPDRPDPEPQAEAEAPPAAEPAAPAPSGEPPQPGRSSEAANFLDLVGLLAQHTAVYLGETALPDGQSMLDLRAAQMHIDLLDALREKTTGNLTAEEGALLGDVLYRLRLAYVEKSRQEA